MAKTASSAHVVTTSVTRGNKTYHCDLLLQSYREGGKVKKRTLANLSKLPPHMSESLKLAAKGEGLTVDPSSVKFGEGLPAGNYDAVLAMAGKLGFKELLFSRKRREREVSVAMAVLLAMGAGGSKLSMHKRLSGFGSAAVLNARLGLGEVGENEMYKALDWLEARQDKIERKLAKRRAAGGTLLLYDATKTWFEGEKCGLAVPGYSPDRPKKSPLIMIGLLCTKEGEPVSVQVYPGNTSEATTLAGQVAKARERFGLRKVAFVGDRGTVTDAGIDSVLAGEADWIAALRHPQVARLVREAQQQGSLFDDRNVAEISGHPDYPGERLVACLNTNKRERDRKRREGALQATELKLGKVAAATNRKRRALRGEARIATRAANALGKSGMNKYFVIEISEDRMSFRRDKEAIAAEAAADGIYVIRTSLEKDDLDADGVVASYKGLSVVEWAFRFMKAQTLGLRPVRHWLEERVRAHVFLCMLAYWLQWHLRHAWKPLLFDDDDPGGPGSERSSPVDPAKPSQSALDKKARQKNKGGFEVMSLADLLDRLSTRTQNMTSFNGMKILFKGVSDPNPLQAEAEKLVNDYQVV